MSLIRICKDPCLSFFKTWQSVNSIEERAITPSSSTGARFDLAKERLLVGLVQMDRCSHKDEACILETSARWLVPAYVLVLVVQHPQASV